MELICLKKNTTKKVSLYHFPLLFIKDFSKTPAILGEYTKNGQNKKNSRFLTILKLLCNVERIFIGIFAGMGINAQEGYAFGHTNSLSHVFSKNILNLFDFYGG